MRIKGSVKTGGRQKGSLNKEKPLKAFLREHSLDYFTPDPETGLSKYDLDMAELEAKERVSAELQLLKYHTAQMQATSVDMTVKDDNLTLVERLALLRDGKPIPKE